MPDKRAVCSMADSIVVDYIPNKLRNIIDRNISISEDIRAVVRGMENEALVITDKGVYVIKKGNCNFFSYDDVLPEKYVHRIYRRGRFEVPLEGKGRVKLPDERTEPDFGPDPANNVVNFPWHKYELFKRAEEILSINKELHDNKKRIPYEAKPEESALVTELMHEIRSLKEEIMMLKKSK